MNRHLARAATEAAAGTEVLPLVSIAVLSHRRPQLLQRVIYGISQLDYPAFEIVVVGDQPSIENYDLPAEFARLIRYRQFVEPNICRARNIAIGLTSGAIIAFCDDDAVPEPNWLRQLVVPFGDQRVGVVGGTVRGADGVKIDWAGGHFDRSGEELSFTKPNGVQIADSVTQLSTNVFLGLMGVNTAFRREALLGVGGFDEAYRYYLDETDVALRLAEAGWSAAFAPAAEVHHLHEVNQSRGSLRTPRNLIQIAASKAFFCRRHLHAGDVESELRRFRAARLADLDPYLRLGVLRNAGREGLAKQLDQGFAEGRMRTSYTPLKKTMGKPGFLRFVPARRARALKIAVVTGWGTGRIRSLRSAARRLAFCGHRVSCFSFMSGPLPLSVTFDAGVWLHGGGTWRPPRRLSGLRTLSRGARSWAEVDRTAQKRGFDLVICSSNPNKPNAVMIARANGLPRLFAVPMAMRGQAFSAAVHQITAFLTENEVDDGLLGRIDRDAENLTDARQDRKNDALMTYREA